MIEPRTEIVLPGKPMAKTMRAGYGTTLPRHSNDTLHNCRSDLQLRRVRLN
jgi:hypothetical protein